MSHIAPQGATQGGTGRIPQRQGNALHRRVVPVQGRGRMEVGTPAEDPSGWGQASLPQGPAKGPYTHSLCLRQVVGGGFVARPLRGPGHTPEQEGIHPAGQAPADTTGQRPGQHPVHRVSQGRAVVVHPGHDEAIGPPMPKSPGVPGLGEEVNVHQEAERGVAPSEPPEFGVDRLRPFTGGEGQDVGGA